MYASYGAKTHRNPFATGGSTKRLYEAGHVQFNTTVDETTIIKHDRIGRNEGDAHKPKRLKVGKISLEDSMSVVPQEPLYVCMAPNDARNVCPYHRPRTQKAYKDCLVSSSLNHIVLNAKDVAKKIHDNTGDADFNEPGGRAFVIELFEEAPKNKERADRLNAFYSLFLTMQLGPAFVGFASGSYEATGRCNKQPQIAANCGGLMTVQCAEEKGAKVGDMLCITYPDDGWQNRQAGVNKDKMTLVVKKSDHKTQRFCNKFTANACKKALAKGCKVESFYLDAYMAQPRGIGQCRSGSSMKGQMIDIKFDMATLSIADMLEKTVIAGMIA
ncbi:MAG: hypothetical protein CMI26_10700 [Opitutae bacterium]|nr:hypothetical protein [Opitutae bacterium]